ASSRAAGKEDGRQQRTGAPADQDLQQQPNDRFDLPWPGRKHPQTLEEKSGILKSERSGGAEPCFTNPRPPLFPVVQPSLRDSFSFRTCNPKLKHWAI